MNIGVLFETDHLSTIKLADEKPDLNLFFIVIPIEIFNKLERLKIGDQKIAFMRSHKFKSSIIYSTYCKYDRDTLHVYSPNCDDRFMQLFLDAMKAYLPNDCIFVTEYKSGMENIGFSDPHVCEGDKICIKKPLIQTPSINKNTVQHDLAYVLMQQSKSQCDLKLCIDKKTFQFLESLTDSPREIFGSLRISSSSVLHTGEILYKMSFNDLRGLTHGESESVSAEPTLYTFHTHPRKAYVANKTKFGFPSVADYISVYKMFTLGMIMHFIVAVEGLYVIYIDPSAPILDQPEPKITSYIKKTMRVENRNLVTDIKKYVQHVNTTSNLFSVQLLNWAEKDSIIHVKFNKHESNCVIRD